MSMREENSHIFERDKHDHYVEDQSTSERLFQYEKFLSPVLDPAAGWCRIPYSAHKAGYIVMASDIVDRKPSKSLDMRRLIRDIPFKKINFLAAEGSDLAWLRSAGAIVSNPPFDQIEEFTTTACSLMRGSSRVQKVALVFPARRLPAAYWLADLPVRRVLYLNPRPSMPTGDFIEAVGRGDRDPKTGKPLKVGGGKQDFAIVIFERDYTGPREVGWLRRGSKQREDRTS